MATAARLADLDAQTSRLVADTDALARRLRWVIREDRKHAQRQEEIYRRHFAN